MKYEARYEQFVNKRYKEPEVGNLKDATREIVEATPTSTMTKKWNL